MKRILTNYRYYVLFILGLVAIIGIFSIPSDNCENWFEVLVISKIVGIAAMLISILLTERWIDEMPELNKYLED